MLQQLLETSLAVDLLSDAMRYNPYWTRVPCHESMSELRRMSKEWKCYFHGCAILTMMNLAECNITLFNGAESVDESM